MHIVFVSKELGLFRGTGGIGTYVWDIARFLASEGHLCTVIAAAGAEAASDAVVEGVRVIALREPEVGERRRIVDFLRFRERFLAYRKCVADALDAVIAAGSVDIVEFAEFGAESFVWQQRPRSVPMVIRWHTPTGGGRSLANVLRYAERRWTQDRTIDACRGADALTFPSRWMAERIVPTGALGPVPWHVIPNGINARDWGHGSARRRDPAAPARLLYVGTLHPRKGFVQLIDAVRQLRNSGLAVTLTLVGKHTRFSKRVERRERDAIRAGWLAVPGEVARESLRACYADADLCCFPAMFDNAPIVCLEAMAAGRIVIGSSNSGMAEVIHHGVDGFLVDPGNVSALAQCIAGVVALPAERRQSIERQARMTILSTFDNSVVSQRLVDFYRRVAERRRAASARPRPATVQP